MKIIFLATLFFGLLCEGCQEKVVPEPQKPITEKPVDTTETNPIDFLALGDSYTIGESVDTKERWPVQFADSLRSRGLSIDSPRIIARTGWTTQDLKIAIENTSDLKNSYQLVSLLIGVNNQYRGYNFEEYERDFPQLLQTALDFTGGDRRRVFVLSIPDYGVTPFGQSNAEQIAKDIDRYNAKAREITEAMDICFFDITPISREAKNDPSLIANDGLHPSGKMYTKWVELVLKSYSTNSISFNK